MARKSLADKINELIAIKPNFGSDEEPEKAKAKIERYDESDALNDLQQSKFRNQNVDTLDKVYKRYVGKKISRKDIYSEEDENTSENMESDDSEEDEELESMLEQDDDMSDDDKKSEEGTVSKNKYIPRINMYLDVIVSENLTDKIMCISNALAINVIIITSLQLLRGLRWCIDLMRS